MSKALSSACLVFLICLGGAAWAKPKIAILGLEVVPGPTGAVEPDATQVARDITKELRQRAQSGASPYAIAPNSSKELTDEKLLMSCDNEAVSCMVVIGAGLAADMLLYGHVERRGESYRVSLKLLDVKAKTVESGGDELPEGGSITGLSKRLYSKLIGDLPGPGGMLIVKARSRSGVEIDSGAVMIDEEHKGDLVSGKLTLTGIPEGRHTVAIEAGGYRRFEEAVTVHGGEQVSLDTVLIEKVTPSSSPPSSAFWKVSLGTGVAAAVAGGVFAYYSFTRANAHFADNIVKVMGNPKASVGSGDCGKTKEQIIMDSNPAVTDFDFVAFERGCTWKTRIYLGFAVGAVGVVGAVASLIMLSRDPEPSEAPPTGARAKKSNVAIVPSLTADGAGASFSMTW